jgi:hypothetical protein
MLLLSLLVSQESKADVTALLIQHGANVNVRNAENWTPLHHASTELIVTLLLKKGADPNAVGPSNLLPIEYKKSATCKQILIEHGSPESRDKPAKRLSAASLTGVEAAAAAEASRSQDRSTEAVLPAEDDTNVPSGRDQLIRTTSVGAAQQASPARNTSVTRHVDAEPGAPLKRASTEIKRSSIGSPAGNMTLQQRKAMLASPGSSSAQLNTIPDAPITSSPMTSANKINVAAPSITPKPAPVALPKSSPVNTPQPNTSNATLPGSASTPTVQNSVTNASSTTAVSTKLSPNKASQTTATAATPNINSIATPTSSGAAPAISAVVAKSPNNSNNGGGSSATNPFAFDAEDDDEVPSAPLSAFNPFA